MMAFLKILNLDHWKGLQSENTRNIAMIDQLNSRITVLDGEVKLLQSDKETGKDNFQFRKTYLLSF